MNNTKNFSRFKDIRSINLFYNQKWDTESSKYKNSPSKVTDAAYQSIRNEAKTEEEQLKLDEFKANPNEPNDKLKNLYEDYLKTKVEVCKIKQDYWKSVLELYKVEEEKGKNSKEYDHALGKHDQLAGKIAIEESQAERKRKTYLEEKNRYNDKRLGYSSNFSRKNQRLVTKFYSKYMNPLEISDEKDDLKSLPSGKEKDFRTRILKLEGELFDMDEKLTEYKTDLSDSKDRLKRNPNDQTAGMHIEHITPMIEKLKSDIEKSDKKLSDLKEEFEDWKVDVYNKVKVDKKRG